LFFLSIRHRTLFHPQYLFYFLPFILRQYSSILIPMSFREEQRTVKTILLVDDEPEILSVLKETLSEYNVITRTDAESALSVIRGGARVDLVLTDNYMPGMKGSELISVLKKDAPAVPVIMLTAYGSVESYLQNMSGGVFEYINKPVKASELRRIVKAAFESKDA
jgi:two-component system response regulator (stage 0 sporulation protein F)